MGYPASDRIRRERYKSEGRCVKCGTALDTTTGVLCNCCRQKAKQGEISRRAKRKLSGKCLRCGGQKVDREISNCIKCRSKRALQNKAQKKAIQEAVLNAYGRACSCCGEAEPLFLQLDHVNDNGADHRRKVGTRMWRWAKDNKFPDSLQLLCCNCNQGKRLNGGICPHVSLRDSSQGST